MFGGDPFGGFSMFNQMHRQMRDMDRMMETMMDPFSFPFGGGMMGHRGGMNMIDDGSRGQHQQQQQVAHPFAQMGLGGFGMGGMGGIFNTMNQLQEHAMNDPNSHVFTQSTMMTFDEQGRPKVTQKSVRKSGDVREERRRYRDNDREEVAIGHTLGDRTHIIEKKRDKDGNVRRQQKFVNLDEASAESFDSEFQSRARANIYGHGRSSASRHAALENGSSRASGSRAPPSSHTHIPPHSGGSGGAPIVTLPEEDEEYQPRRSYGSRPSGHQNTGPIIREISDEEAESSISKKRRGFN